MAAINYMVETVEKTPQLKGKLTISHAFALATLNEQQVDKLAHRMVAQHFYRLDGADWHAAYAAQTVARQRRKSHDRHRQRYRPLVTLRPGRHAGKANLYAQLYIRPNEQNLSRSLF